MKRIECFSGKCIVKGDPSLRSNSNTGDRVTQIMLNVIFLNSSRANKAQYNVFLP